MEIINFQNADYKSLKFVFILLLKAIESYLIKMFRG